MPVTLVLLPLLLISLVSGKTIQTEDVQDLLVIPYAPRLYPVRRLAHNRGLQGSHESRDGNRPGASDVSGFNKTDSRKSNGVNNRVNASQAHHTSTGNNASREDAMALRHNMTNTAIDNRELDRVHRRPATNNTAVLQNMPTSRTWLHNSSRENSNKTQQLDERRETDEGASTSMGNGRDTPGKEDSKEDKWVWAGGDTMPTPSTSLTPFTLENRDVFVMDKCPSDMKKVFGICVTPN